MSHIDKTNAAKPILKELKHNHVVAILIDQWASAEGMWIDFFGLAASTTSIPARIARKTGAALIPAYCIRTRPGQYEIQIHEEVPFPKDTPDWEEKLTRELNRRLEEQILTYPEQWTWTHRRWKSTRHYRTEKIPA